MRKLRIVILLSATVVAIAIISFNIALAQGSEGGDSNVSKLATKVARILGLDTVIVDDAIKEAREELRDEAGQGKKTSWEDIGLRLGSAVERGEVTKEQAEERLKAWKKDQLEDLKAKKASHKTDVEDVRAELKAWVDAGKMTQEQADEKLAWLEAREYSRRVTEQGIKARIQAAVETGQITQEQADARLEAFKARAKGSKRSDDAFDVAGAVSRAKVSLEEGETTLDALEARLQSAVKGGRLTQDDADAIMKRLKQ